MKVINTLALDIAAELDSNDLPLRSTFFMPKKDTKIYIII
jgi:hypothetical protein